MIIYVDEGRLAFIHVDSIRQMEIRNSSSVLLSQDRKFKPSIAFDEDNSLYVYTPESIRHFNPVLVELQTFAYKYFYSPIRMQNLPTSEYSGPAAATTAVLSPGTVTGFRFGQANTNNKFIIFLKTNKLLHQYNQWSYSRNIK